MSDTKRLREIGKDALADWGRYVRMGSHLPELGVKPQSIVPTARNVEPVWVPRCEWMSEAACGEISRLYGALSRRRQVVVWDEFVRKAEIAEAIQIETDMERSGVAIDANQLQGWVFDVTEMAKSYVSPVGLMSVRRALAPPILINKSLSSSQAWGEFSASRVWGELSALQEHLIGALHSVSRYGGWLVRYREDQRRWAKSLAASVNQDQLTQRQHAVAAANANWASERLQVVSRSVSRLEQLVAAQRARMDKLAERVRQSPRPTGKPIDRLTERMAARRGLKKSRWCEISNDFATQTGRLVLNA